MGCVPECSLTSFIALSNIPLLVLFIPGDGSKRPLLFQHIEHDKALRLLLPLKGK